MTTLLEKTLSFIAPHECILCGNENNIVCAECSEALINERFCQCPVCLLPAAYSQPCPGCRVSTSFDALYVMGGHDNELKQLVSLLKFSGVRQVASDIAPVFCSLLPHFEDPLTVTYLPTAYTRSRQRGFDQARLLAEAVAGQHSWPVKRLLQRHGDTRQLGAGKYRRKSQAQDMFGIVPSHSLAGQSILLVDDVITTGASMEAAATCLKRAGAAHVYGLAIARRTS